MLEKSILNRIEKLEIQFPIIDFDTKEYTKNIITELEAVLEYEIKDRIKLPKEHYFDIDTLYKAIFSFLTVKELKTIAYYSDNKKTK